MVDRASGLRRVLSAALMVTCGSFSAFGQSKVTAYGIFDLLPVDSVASPFKDLASEHCWTNPNVVGVVLRTDWNKVEGVKGQFDWSFLDEGVALAKVSNKKISITIIAGIYSPAWVYTDGAAQFAITHVGVMPSPWDPVFQADWAAFISAFAQRYDSVPEVAYITMSGPGRGEELYFVETKDDVADLNAVGGVQIWVTAAEKIADMYGSTFKQTPVLYATGLPVPGSAGRTALSDVVNYDVNAYPGHFGIKSDGLRPNYSPKSFGALTIPALSGTTTVGFQMLLPFNGGQNMHGTLQDTLSIGISYRAHFIEVYDADCSDPSQAQAISSANVRLTGS
jgi:hypothetical protein